MTIISDEREHVNALEKKDSIQPHSSIVNKLHWYLLWWDFSENHWDYPSLDSRTQTSVDLHRLRSLRQLEPLLPSTFVTQFRIEILLVCINKLRWSTDIHLRNTKARQVRNLYMYKNNPTAVNKNSSITVQDAFKIPADSGGRGRKKMLD